VIQYIARNPIKPNLVQKITDYRWSAHLEIVARKQENVCSNRLFELLGGNIEKGKSIYFKLIQEAQQKVVAKFRTEYKSIKSTYRCS